MFLSMMLGILPLSLLITLIFSFLYLCFGWERFVWLLCLVCFGCCILGLVFNEFSLCQKKKKKKFQNTIGRRPSHLIMTMFMWQSKRTRPATKQSGFIASIFLALDYSRTRIFAKSGTLVNYKMLGLQQCTSLSWSYANFRQVRLIETIRGVKLSI